MELLNEIKTKMGTMEKNERQKTICDIKNFIINAVRYEFTAKRFLMTRFLPFNTEWSILWKETRCELHNNKRKTKKVLEYILIGNDVPTNDNVGIEINSVEKELLLKTSMITTERDASKYDEIRDEQMALDIISYLGINKEFEEWDGVGYQISRR
jgi:hypothetical protein